MIVIIHLSSINTFFNYLFNVQKEQFFQRYKIIFINFARLIKVIMGVSCVKGKQKQMNPNIEPIIEPIIGPIIESNKIQPQQNKQPQKPKSQIKKAQIITKEAEKSDDSDADIFILDQYQNQNQIPQVYNHLCSFIKQYLTSKNILTPLFLTPLQKLQKSQFTQLRDIVNSNQEYSRQNLQKMMRIKQKYNPLKQKILAEVANYGKILKKQKVVFIFYSRSKDLQKLKQKIQLKSKKNQVFNKQGLTLYDPIEFEETFYFIMPKKIKKSNLLLKLFRQYYIKPIINDCSQFNVLCLLSNTRHIEQLCTLIKISFEVNFQRVIKNLDIFYYGSCSNIAVAKHFIESAKIKIDSEKDLSKIKIINLMNDETPSLQRQNFLTKNTEFSEFQLLDQQIYALLYRQTEIICQIIQKQTKILIKNKQSVLDPTSKFKNAYQQNINQLTFYMKFKSNKTKNLKKQVYENLKNNLKSLVQQNFNVKQLGIQNLSIKDFQNNDIVIINITKKIQYLEILKNAKYSQQLKEISDFFRDEYLNLKNKLEKKCKTLIEAVLKSSNNKQNKKNPNQVLELNKRIASIMDKIINQPNKKFLDILYEQKLSNFNRVKQSKQKWLMFQQLYFLTDNPNKLKNLQGKYEEFLQQKRNNLNVISIELAKIKSNNPINYQIIKTTLQKIIKSEQDYEIQQNIFKNLKQIKEDLQKHISNLITNIITTANRIIIESNKKQEQRLLTQSKKNIQNIELFLKLNVITSVNPQYASSKITIEQHSRDKEQIQLLESCLNNLSEFQKTGNEQNLKQIPNKINKIKAKKSNLPTLSKKCNQLYQSFTTKCNNLFSTHMNTLMGMINAKQLPQNIPDKVKKQESIVNQLINTTVITSTIAFKQYQNTKKKIITQVQNYLNNFNDIVLINEETNNTEQNRKKYYIGLNVNISSVVPKVFLMQKSTNKFNTIITTINQNIDKIYKKCMSIAQKSSSLSQKQYQQFNIYYLNLISLDTWIKAPFLRKRLFIPDITKIKSQFQQTLNQIYQKQNKDDLCQNMLQIYSFRKIQFLNNQILNKITNKIKQLQKKDQLNQFIGQLNRTTEGIKFIKNNSNIQTYINQQLNKKRFSYDIDYVIKEIQFQNGDIDKSKLKNKFLKYQKQYDYIVKRNNNNQRQENIKKLVDELKNKFQLKIFDNSKFKKTLNQLEQVLSYISAIWTLVHIRILLSTDSTINISPDALFKIHPAQVIAIFRIFGFENGYENNLVQILTGQGKSVILAFSSAILALNGFEVNCACYSQYLSERDFEDFLPLFNVLGLEEKIYYGTFNKICSKILDENGQIRKLVGQFFINGDYIVSKKSSNVPKVLLIDQVDVFVSEEFHGKCYQPVFVLKDPLFKALTDLMWNKRFDQKKYQSITPSKQYKQFLNKYNRNGELIDQIIKQMIYAIDTINSAPKGIYNQEMEKIGYRLQDRIDYNVAYGYSTLFSYYQLKDEGVITDQQIKKNAFFEISCGSYSYAQIFKKFQYIVGVTGTLKKLNKQTQNIIKQTHKINKFTYVPSIYGKTNLRFLSDQDIYIYKQQEYHARIKDRIQLKININRAVLVVFQTEQKLMRFYENPKNKLKNMSYYTERSTRDQKFKMVAQATTVDKITLIVKSFGRGTDFFCLDKKLIANGGLHVIQTFLSQNVSEQDQIKGRTARQGAIGSYELILLQSELQKYQITLYQLDNNRGNKLYNFLNEKRNLQFDKKCKLIQEKVENANILNKDSEQFYRHLLEKAYYKVEEGLLKFNKAPQLNIQKYKTVILFGSGISKQFISWIGKAIHQIKVTLQECKYHDESLQIKQIFYKPYNSKIQNSLVASDWEFKEENITKHLQMQQNGKVEQDEPVEVGLAFVDSLLDSNKIDQVILIGSTVPTHPDQIQVRRQNGYNSSIWQKNKVSNYKQQSQKLANKGIKIMCYYINQKAKSSFQEISSITNGNCRPIDINDMKNNQQFKTSIIQGILSKISPVLTMQTNKQLQKHY